MTMTDRTLIDRATDGWQPQWRHLKRGTEYMMVGRAEVQASEPLTEAELVAVYRARDGRLWVRRWAEFHDGRFEALPPQPASASYPDLDPSILDRDAGLGRSLDTLPHPASNVPVAVNCHQVGLLNPGVAAGHPKLTLISDEI